MMFLYLNILIELLSLVFTSFMLPLLNYVLYQFLVDESGLYKKIFLLEKWFSVDPH